MPCMEKIHPYLNQIDPENETILDNIDDLKKKYETYNVIDKILLLK